MTELKLRTLNDFDIGENYQKDIYVGCALIEDLRKEAIKWINHLANNNDELGAKAFALFFNITSEDLK